MKSEYGTIELLCKKLIESSQGTGRNPRLRAARRLYTQFKILRARAGLLDIDLDDGLRIIREGIRSQSLEQLEPEETTFTHLSYCLPEVPIPSLHLLARKVNVIGSALPDQVKTRSLWSGYIKEYPEDTPPKWQQLVSQLTIYEKRSVMKPIAAIVRGDIKSLDRLRGLAPEELLRIRNINMISSLFLLNMFKIDPNSEKEQV